MRFKTKHFNISAGNFSVALLHLNDAITLDVYPSDRLVIKKGSRKIICIVDVTRDEKIVKPGVLGLFKEAYEKFGSKDGITVDATVTRRPESLKFIRQKLGGKPLTKNQIDSIVSDIAEWKLSATEVTYFVSACYVHGLSINETYNLTKAMVNSGQILRPKAKRVFDKHCIGGLPGNRTTPLVVSIAAAAGLTVPKTSSRSITSPAGTADTMEVIANVKIPLKRMKQIVDSVGGCMVWGGALNLSPADDAIIQVEHPLSIDAEGQLLASILAKKLSVSSTDILIDIPAANDAKVDRKKAQHLRKKFLQLAKKFHINMRVLITDGRQPIGKGIGPGLEARDVLWILKGDPKGPADLKKKALMLAGEMLEMGKKAKKGEGFQIAKEILESGAAYEKFVEIVKAQGEKQLDPEKIKPGKYFFDYKSSKAGDVIDIDNSLITAVAKATGAPVDKGAGVYLNYHIADDINIGDILFTIYSDNKEKLEYAKSLLYRNPVFIRRKKEKAKKPEPYKRREILTKQSA
ncbi:AMP phosphorylase [Candidatus Woesearchaeota archaeon]|nr:AMP phosphorylase [Candidatus Woesearchaeota archaeon]